MDHDKAETITSSPSFSLPAALSAEIANRFALEPELQATACGYGRNAFSNSLTFSPCVTFFDLKTSTAADISSSPNVGSCSLIQVCDLDEDGRSVSFEGVTVLGHNSIGTL